MTQVNEIQLEPTPADRRLTHGVQTGESAAAALRIDEHRGIEELDALRGEWEAAWRATPGASFFQSLGWLQAYWRHLAAEQQLRVVAVRQDDRLLGIVPLVVRRERTKLGMLRVLTYPLHDWGSFYGPIGVAPPEARRATLRHIAAGRRDWDILELRWLGGPGSEGAEATADDFAAAGLQNYLTPMKTTALVEFAGDWPSYQAERPAHWRKNLRAIERHLGPTRFVRFRPGGAAAGDDDPRWDLYDLCEEISRRSWQGGATNGTTLSHDAVRPFLRAAHAAAAAAGAVEINLLCGDDRPLAYTYCYVWQGCIYGLRRGYDPAASRDGAGHALLAYSIRDSFERGDRWFDLGVGSLETKRAWMTREAPIYRVSHYARTAWRAQVLRVRRWYESRRAADAAAESAEW